MTKLDNPVLMATIGGTHGVRGEVRVKSFTGDPEAMGDYGPLHLEDGRTLTVLSTRPSKTVLIVRFKEITSREQAAALNGQNLYVDRASLPDDKDEDEFYITDLMGLDVVDTDGKSIGTVIAVPDFGAGDLLEIQPVASGPVKGSRSFFLEFTKANVPKVDLDKGHISVVLPPEVSERD
ncbi:MAG: ribosome maturation factor RimM [Pseudomonadota bacterium]